MRCLLVGLMVGLSCRAGAQVSVPEVDMHRVPDVATEMMKTPPTFKLTPHGPGGRTGDVWVRTSAEGLQIWGRVVADRDTIMWPRQKSEMLASDHLEIWLAAEPEVAMPEIGWGNQFGETTLKSVKDCDANGDKGPDGEKARALCVRWFAEQGPYRSALKRLFTRQWLIAEGQYGAPDQSNIFEDYASQGYAALQGMLFPRDLPVELEPMEKDGVTAEFGNESRPETRHDAAGHAYQQAHQTAYTYHVVIPYAAFPPAREKTLKDLRLMVDAFAPAPEGKKMGEWSTTSAGRVWGKAETFNEVHLEKPRTSVYSPCDEGMAHADLYGNGHEGWYRPGASEVLKESFSLENAAAGYLYDPGPPSPLVSMRKAFWVELKDGATVCGPELAWKKGAAIQRTKFVVEEKYVERKALADGWSLVKFGPTTSTHSPFGSGQCGACEVMGMEVYAVSPAGEITSALSLEQDMSGEHDGPDATDLAIAADWGKITLFKRFEGLEEKKPETHWESESYCLTGHAYTACGSMKKAIPPKPANFKELESDE